MPDIFRYNPLTRLFTQRGAPDDYLLDLETITNGRYYVTGNQIRDSLAVGNPVVAGIPLMRDAEVVKDEGGNVWITSDVPQWQVNKVRSGVVRWSGQIDAVTMPDGTSVRPQNATFGITPYGTRLYVRTDPVTGDRQFLTVPYDPDTGEDTIAFPRSYRLASPRESLEYGAIGWLSSTGKQIVAQAMSQGMYDENGDPITKFTEAAIYLSATLDVSAGRTTKLL